MNRLVFLLVGLALGWAPASAQIDPDPDGLGLYFDTEATVSCQDVPLGVPTEMYLILTHATAANGVAGWECSIAWDNPFITILDWYAPGFQGSVWNPPDFAIGLANPLPWSEAITLLVMRVIVFTPECTWFYLQPYPDPSLPDQIAYVETDHPLTPIPMYPSTGSFDLPVAGLFCDDPPSVKTDGQTWGQMKALYR